MLLCRKVDNQSWDRKTSVVEHEHLAQLDCSGLAGPGVSSEVLRERLLELKRNALTHYADRIDGVNERVHLCFEQISLGLVNH